RPRSSPSSRSPTTSTSISSTRGPHSASARRSGASGIRVGSPYADGVALEPSEVEQGCVAQTATVAEAAGQPLHALDTCIHGLAAGVGNALDDGVDDSPKVIAKHRADSLHRLEAATSEPGDESVPSAERPGGAHVTPERDRELLHGPGSGGAQCGSPEHVEDL